MYHNEQSTFEETNRKDSKTIIFLSKSKIVETWTKFKIWDIWLCSQFPKTSIGQQNPTTILSKDIMPILHIDPFSPAFDSAFNQAVLFNNANTTLKPRTAKKAKRTWQPNFVHIQTTDEKYSILIDVPGVKQGDMQMQLTDKNQTLLLSGIRKFPRHPTTGSKEKEGEEIDEAKFEKRFNIGNDVDAEKITADLSDGVLTITAPKKAAPTPVTIPIQVGGSKL